MLLSHLILKIKVHDNNEQTGAPSENLQNVKYSLRYKIPFWSLTNFKMKNKNMP